MGAISAAEATSFQPQSRPLVRRLLHFSSTRNQRSTVISLLGLALRPMQSSLESSGYWQPTSTFSLKWLTTSTPCSNPASKKSSTPPTGETASPFPAAPASRTCSTPSAWRATRTRSTTCASGRWATKRRPRCMPCPTTSCATCSTSRRAAAPVCWTRSSSTSPSSTSSLSPVSRRPGRARSTW